MIKVDEEVVGLESLFARDDLKLLDCEEGMLLDDDFDLLNGTETPLGSFVALEQDLEPADKRIKTEAISSSDSPEAIISKLQAELRAKDEELQRLKGSSVGKVAARSLFDEDDWSRVDIFATSLDEFEGLAPVCTPFSGRKASADKVSPSSKKRALESLDLAGAPAKKARKNMLGRKTMSENDISLVKTEPILAEEEEEEEHMIPATLSAAAAAKISLSLAEEDAVSSSEEEECKARDDSEDEDLAEESLDDRDDSELSEADKLKRRWTAEQDEELRVAVTKHNGQNWKAIARMVTGRDHVQCLQRWKKVLQPGLVKGMWCKEEDDMLLKLMSTSQHKNWAEVALLVPGRTAKQCRERWSLNLDPSINRGPWTQEEDELLIKLHDKLGNKWAQIKCHLASRTENAVKTRFKSIERARVKDSEVTWTSELEQQLHEIAVRFECRIDEVAKHLPRALRGISSQAMRQHCPLLRDSEEKSLTF